ncbi:MAG: radical SAM protein [Methanocalculaceae archaeon]|jgi:radical SAM superfamily enzyme with C-terminal helix-hairpin-helix motif|nr:radical SAM protein [Methanocalculaceae archaeon]
MISDAIIIDGYVDEPACLGVPPYISPYIRTISGVFAERCITTDYATIDQLRKDPMRVANLSAYKYVVMIAGVTVPGKYFAGTPATLTELQQIGFMLRGKVVSLLGGPIGFGYSPQGGKKAIAQAASGWTTMLHGEPAAALDAYLSGGEPKGICRYPDYDRWAVLGAEIIRKHPFYPFVMCELETAKGCSRVISGGCSFCTEPFYGLPKQRDVAGITEEVRALTTAGATHFRLGRQPDILTFGSTSGGEFPTPNPDALQKLFAEIRSAAPSLQTLHIDNINPGTIAQHEEEAREALETIVAGHTTGDIAAFGMESADPVVVAANNLKSDADAVFRAVEIVNEVGAVRKDGIPELLPGLNFIAGLAGETAETFVLNEIFLQRIFSAELLVRRVNIRQLMPFEGTRAYAHNTLRQHDKLYHQFKERVRTTFDMPMLKRVFPIGTVLRDIIIEVSGSVSFGRQMGTYPILCGVPIQIPPRTVMDAVVVSHGQRSITVLPVPIEINRLNTTALKWLPGVSKKTAAKISSKKPYKDATAFQLIVSADAIYPLIDLMRF